MSYLSSLCVFTAGKGESRRQRERQSTRERVRKDTRESQSKDGGPVKGEKRDSIFGQNV